MDKKIMSNVILGVFVLLGLSLFVFLVLNMGGGTGLFSRQYSLYGKFAHVKGLHAGSEVSLSGLRVGTVKDIVIAPGAANELVVEFSIQRKFQEKIRKDSLAKVTTQGVLGDKYIELTIGSADQPELKEGDLIATDEVADIFSKGSGLVEEIGKHFEKGGDFEELIRNLNTVSKNLAVFTASLNKNKGLGYELTNGQSGEKLSKTLANLESITKKIDSGQGSLGGLVNDPTIYEDLKIMMGGAKRSSVLKSVMKSFLDDGKAAEKAAPKSQKAP